jgi:hypothetical protein
VIRIPHGGASPDAPVFSRLPAAVLRQEHRAEQRLVAEPPSPARLRDDEQVPALDLR